jgi:hypothetical protein
MMRMNPRREGGSPPRPPTPLPPGFRGGKSEGVGQRRRKKDLTYRRHEARKDVGAPGKLHQGVVGVDRDAEVARRDARELEVLVRIGARDDAGRD